MNGKKVELKYEDSTSKAEQGKSAAAEKPAGKPAPPPEDPALKVYRIRPDLEEPEEPPAPRQSAPPPRPAPPPAAPAPARLAPSPPKPPPPRPAPAPVLRSRPAVPPPAPPAPAPAAPRFAAPEPEAEPARPPTAAAPGAWVATLLFVLLLLFSLALAGYTLARPFLPEDWFR